MICLNRIANPIIEISLGKNVKVLQSASKICQLCGGIFLFATGGAMIISTALPTIIVLQGLSLTAFIISTLIQNYLIKTCESVKLEALNLNKNHTSSKEDVLENALRAKSEEIFQLKRNLEILKKEKGSEVGNILKSKNADIQYLRDQLAGSKLSEDKFTLSLNTLRKEKEKLETELQTLRTITERTQKQSEEVHNQFKKQITSLTSELEKEREDKSKNKVEPLPVNSAPSTTIKIRQLQAQQILPSSIASISNKNLKQTFHYKEKTYQELLKLNEKASQEELLYDLTALNKLLLTFTAFLKIDLTNGPRPLIVLNQAEMKFIPKATGISSLWLSMKLNSKEDSIEQNLDQLARTFSVLGSKIDYLYDKQFTDEKFAKQIFEIIAQSITVLSIIKARYATSSRVIPSFQKTKEILENTAEKSRMLMPLPDIDRHTASLIGNETGGEENSTEITQPNQMLPPPPPPPPLNNCMTLIPPPPPPPPGSGLAPFIHNLTTGKSVGIPANYAEDRKKNQIADCEQKLAAAKKEQMDLSEQTRAAKNKYNEFELERKKYNEKLISALRGYQILEGQLKDKDEERNKFVRIKDEFQECLNVLKKASKKETVVIFQEEEYRSEENLNKLEKDLIENLPTLEKAIVEINISIDKLAKELELKVNSSEFGNLREINEEYKNWDNSIRSAKNHLFKLDQALGEKKASVIKLENELKKLTTPESVSHTKVSLKGAVPIDPAKLMEEIQKKGKKSQVTSLMADLGLKQT